MRKTSVYLTEDEVEGLRRVAVRTGRSQSQLIREAIRSVLDRNGERPRRFRSMGMGHGGGNRHTGWNADELYRAVMGKQ